MQLVKYSGALGYHYNDRVSVYYNNRQLHVSSEHVAISFEGERETMKNGKGKMTL